MVGIRALLLKRIGLPEKGEIDFASLDTVLEYMSRSIPFENLRIMAKKTLTISEESLIDKMLIRNEGGLCYELNTIFYLFLKELGFRVRLTSGVVYDSKKQAFAGTGRTHVTILLDQDSETYLVDAGFGGSIPLTPVPFSGHSVTSNNGEFRVDRTGHELGSHALMLKLRYKDTDWRTGYVFDVNQPEVDFETMNAIQTIIAEHPASAFRQNPLITMRTATGNMTLTGESFTEWEHGQVTKTAVDDAGFRSILKSRFGLNDLV
jgi:N-hydroxyarylamine O-acetyltransferase